MSGPVIIAELPKNSRERLRVSLTEWQGHQLFDIRVTAQIGQSDVWSPTKKGASVSIAMLPQLLAAVTAAEAKARELGLIGGDT